MKSTKFYRCMAGIVGLFSLLSCFNQVFGQIRPLNAQFYNNQYISNASFAGIEPGINLNLAYQNQWRGIKGSPITMAASGEYRINRAGVGFFVYNEKAGLLNKTRATVTYAYHFPINKEGQTLHFGVSLGMLNTQLQQQGIIGDSGDELAVLFNQRGAKIDGDFGIAFISNNLTLQGALPNLGKLFRKDEQNTIDGYTYMAAVAYKIAIGSGSTSFEPKLSIRGAKGIPVGWDLGSNLQLQNNILSFIGMFHSDNSSTLGLGVKYNKIVLQCFYTNQWVGERVNSGGDFEVGLKFSRF